MRASLTMENNARDSKFVTRVANLEYSSPLLETAGLSSLVGLQLDCAAGVDRGTSVFPVCGNTTCEAGATPRGDDFTGVPHPPLDVASAISRHRKETALTRLLRLLV